MTVNAKILYDRECKHLKWPWMQISFMTVNTKILLDRGCKDFAWRWMPGPAWQRMQRFTMTVNAKILHDRECKYLIWTWMQRFYMTVNARTWMNVDERGWTWMSISKRRWPYPISAIMFSPLVLFLLKLLKCLDSNPLSISVPDEGYSRNAPRYNLSTMYCWKWH
jgi:hypothetical protein